MDRVVDTWVVDAKPNRRPAHSSTSKCTSSSSRSARILSRTSQHEGHLQPRPAAARGRRVTVPVWPADCPCHDAASSRAPTATPQSLVRSYSSRRSGSQSASGGSHNPVAASESHVRVTGDRIGPPARGHGIGTRVWVLVP